MGHPKDDRAEIHNYLSWRVCDAIEAFEKVQQSIPARSYPQFPPEWENLTSEEQDHFIDHCTYAFNDQLYTNIVYGEIIDYAMLEMARENKRKENRKMATSYIYFGFEWGYGNNHFEVRELEDKLTPFMNKKPKEIAVTFHDTIQVYRKDFTDVQPGGVDAPSVSLSIHWGFGGNYFEVKDELENMYHFFGKKANGITVTFQDTEEVFNGVFRDANKERTPGSNA